MAPFVERNPIFQELHTQMQATPTGWNHPVYAWGLREPLPVLPILLPSSGGA